MTQWYAARELESGPNAGKWHYTCSNSSGSSIYPVGACADHCPGHETPEAALRHYVEGLAAGEIREREDPDEQKKCVKCAAWTQHRAMLWGVMHPDEIAICIAPDHDARAALRAAVFARYHLEVENPHV